MPQPKTKLANFNWSKQGLETIGRQSFTNYDLEAIRVLDLSENKIKSIAPDSFSGMTNLEELNLSWNEIAVIDEKLFSGLVKLRELKLEGNKIKWLSRNSFRGLASLTLLWFNKNEIEIIDEALFQDLESLKQLCLSENRMTSLPAFVFNPLRSRLEWLGFRACRIETVNEALFNGLSQLKELYLQQNQDEHASIPSTLFKDLKSLEHLGLVPAADGSVDERLLVGLNRLTTVNGVARADMINNNTSLQNGITFMDLGEIQTKK
jgi:hypothetical protein